jgi:hypothetical protein
MIELDDMINRLRILREEGQQVISPKFTVMYNPHTETFFMDVPETRKQLALKSDELDDVFFWDCTGMYPVAVKFKGDYDSVWKDLEPYSEGATLDLLPYSLNENGVEYVWLEDFEKGYLSVEKNKLQIMD